MSSSGNSFKHLPIPVHRTGRARLSGGGKVDTVTRQNQENRKEHSTSLWQNVDNITTLWQQRRETRSNEGAPPLPPSIPVTIQIDSNEYDIDFVFNQFGLEIVSEQEDGFLLVAGEDANFTRFREKVEAFAQGSNTGAEKTASIHRIYEDETQEIRLSRVLSDELFQHWSNISDGQFYIVDVAINCICQATIPLPPHWYKHRYKIERNFLNKVENWEHTKETAYQIWDENKRHREQEIEEFVNFYQGEILSIVDGTDYGFADLPDSFTVRVKINGKGLRDLVLNYPYLFELVEPDDIGIPVSRLTAEGETVDVLNILPPESSFPTVCVIDSGIQERHRLLSDAIVPERSYCFLPGESTENTGDFVQPNGHGTRVAGAILYPNGIPTNGDYQLPCWIENARVLDSDNYLPKSIFPPNLLRSIIYKYHYDGGTRIFNHSITSINPCRLRYMSAWAAEMDRLSFENDILFIQAAGNIKSSEANHTRLGIMQHMQQGREYPDYLLEPSCRIRNPAQSFQALTVGSICFEDFSQEGISILGMEGAPSAFSPTGPGIWGVIKPDVVEFGGTFVTSGQPLQISLHNLSCPELVRTSPPGPAYSRDGLGTSYTTPKVTNIAAALERVLPNAPCLLYRALIAQSAQWPNWARNLSENDHYKILRHMGYGVPDIERATSNTPYRITFITLDTQHIKAYEAQIFKVKIPERLRRPGDAYQIKIEITLSYAANPRRSRRNLRQYLSVWVDWATSKRGESLEAFADRVLRDTNENTPDRDGEGELPWMLHTHVNWGTARGTRRNLGTLQKDVAILESHDIPPDFCIAVVGHPSWDRNPESQAKYSLAVSFEAINKDIEIYELIESENRIEIEQIIEEEIEIEF